MTNTKKTFSRFYDTNTKLPPARQASMLTADGIAAADSREADDEMRGSNPSDELADAMMSVECEWTE
jgi:hypothetical protein